MAKDYVADNAGQGFASFDDDGPNDLESLLAGAALGEEQDDEDTSSFFDKDDIHHEEVSAVYTSQSAGIDKNPVPTIESVYVSETPVPEPTPEYEPQESYVEPVVEEEVPEVEDTYSYSTPATPTPSYSAPVVTPPSDRRPRSWERDPNPNFAQSAPTPGPPPVNTASRNSRIHIPSEAEEIQLASKTIRIIDAYRKLNSEVKTAASQFITNGTEIIEDEATLVVKVLNVDPMLPITMRSLREAKAKDPVERVFYVIDLSDDVLHSLGALVSVFSDVALDPRETKINYARKLVQEIDKLEARAVNYVESTESILAAADGESN